jgi:hypothetical protein
VVAGARRFAHSALLRADRALPALLGIERFPTDGTIRNLFKRFTQGMVVRFYEPLWAWQLARLPKREGGYSLDLDSTALERYGEQEGVKKAYNPRKPGRGSHHPLLAVLGEAHFILHGWLRSGNTRADSGVVEFLKEALAKLQGLEWIRRVRADAGFFAEELLNPNNQGSTPSLLEPGRARAGGAKMALLQIDSFHGMGGAHHAKVIRAMRKPKSVAQFVEGLLQEALLEELGIFGHAIEFRVQTMSGNQRAGVAQLGFAKNEGQDGDVKVHVGHCQDAPAFRMRTL